MRSTHSGQWYFGRNAGYFTPKVIHFHHPKKTFLDQNIWKKCCLILKTEALTGGDLLPHGQNAYKTSIVRIKAPNQHLFSSFNACNSDGGIVFGGNGFQLGHKTTILSIKAPGEHIFSAFDACDSNGGSVLGGSGFQLGRGFGGRRRRGKLVCHLGCLFELAPGMQGAQRTGQLD